MIPFGSYLQICNLEAGLILSFGNGLSYMFRLGTVAKPDVIFLITVFGARLDICDKLFLGIFGKPAVGLPILLCGVQSIAIPRQCSYCSSAGVKSNASQNEAHTRSQRRPFPRTLKQAVLRGSSCFHSSPLFTNFCMDFAPSCVNESYCFMHGCYGVDAPTHSERPCYFSDVSQCSLAIKI